MKLKKPKFWDYKKPNFFAFLLLPITLVIEVSNYLIKIKKKKIYENIKTICVGNIYIGGTGKTPLVIKLNEILKKNGFKTATIKKYYSDQLDEQKLLDRYTNFYCSKKRVRSLEQAIKDKIDLAIFDDGLQDRNLNYNLKFVCFNTEKWIGNGFLIPSGPLRNRLSSLKDFDAVFLNGNEENNFEIKETIKKSNQNIKIFETSYEIINLKKLDRNGRYIIFSGIGNPESFSKTLKRYNFNIIKELNFPDHYKYLDKDIMQIKETAKKYNVQILTTEKDFIKINLDYSNDINYVKIELRIKEEERLIKFLKNSL